jgi:superfamily II DNA or RNA helicase
MNNASPYATPWFSTKVLQKITSPPTWNSGLLLYLAHKVPSIDIEPEGERWHIWGEVQDTASWPFEIDINLTLGPDGEVDDWESKCDCQVGYKCKHGVALLLQAVHQGRQLIAEQATSGAHAVTLTPEQAEAARRIVQARADELARAQAENQLLRWLQELDRTSGRAPALRATLAATLRGPGQVKEKVEAYLYLLSVTGPTAQPMLLLEAVVAYRKQNGDWSKPRSIRQPPRTGMPAYDRATPLDHEVLELISTLPGLMANRYPAASTLSGVPQGRVGQIALEQAAQTGRLFLNDHGSPGHAIQWGPAQTLNWAWHEVPDPSGAEPGWALRAQLEDKHHKLCFNQPPLYLNTKQGQCGPVQADGIATAQLDVLLKAPALKAAVLQKHQQGLIERLGPLPLPPMLMQLTTLKDVIPTAHLHITRNSPQDIPRKGLLQAELRFDYDGHRGWWAGQGNTVLIDKTSERLLLHRDAETELDAISSLIDRGLTAGDHGLFIIPGQASQQTWLRWTDDDFAELHDAGFEVSVDRGLQDLITHADVLAVQLQSQDGDDGAGATSAWFNLSLGMEINGQRHNILPWLPDLIGAAASSPLNPVTGLPNLPPFLYLRAPEGPGFIRLPTDALKPWMAALLELVGDRAYDFSGESLKLSRLDALRTGAALGEGAVWDGAQALRDMMQHLSGRAALPEVALPPSVQASLRPYQQQGVNWLQFLRQHSLGGILADDMGLGKTLQTLVHIQIEKDAGRLTHPALIIAPVSLMGNWRRETERFCPQLRCLVLHGKDRHEMADRMGEFDVVIAPYSLLQRDRERWLEVQWHLVVLDEAQNIKNASTHAAQVVGKLRTRHRLCLSGTPMENHLGEIWSLFHFLMPGFLGSQKRFAELFRTPIEKQGDPERLDQLRARITPFMLRRTKAVVADELPPKVETILRVALSGKQADLYETIRLGMEKTVREALNTQGLAKSQITILDALLKLRQVCCDPHLLKLDAAKKVKASAKLEHLMTLLPDMLAEGRRILLFSQFTSMLTLIEAELAKRNIPWVKLTGQSQKRDTLIEQFTSGAVPLFLISLKAGGVGLNLPQADTVIHYDPWWNPAVETQATDRAHRIGQKQSVWVVKLVAQGTIEERILALQERKALLAESMYSGSVGRKEPLFNESDLAELLKPLSA